MEAMKAMAKLETARAIANAVKTLATVNDDGPDLVVEYFHVGPFTDEDVVGITAAQLSDCITLLQQCALLMTGANDGAGHSTITPAEYVATLNAVRRVAG
jgi:chloramphenicol 3-O-phosphotransferase